jgi:ferritin-like metal-binding protein YciE
MTGSDSPHNSWSHRAQAIADLFYPLRLADFLFAGVSTSLNFLNLMVIQGRSFIVFKNDVLLSKLVGVGGALEGHSSLSDIYIQELRDVWSALDQMGESLTLFQKKSMDARLLELLSKSRELAFLLGELVEKCLRSSNGQLSKKRCHGMEGISYEVQQNLTRDAETDALQIVAVLSQFQKIAQYVRGGLETARSFAEVLGEHVAYTDLGEGIASLLIVEKCADDLIFDASRSSE